MKQFIAGGFLAAIIVIAHVNDALPDWVIPLFESLYMGSIGRMNLATDSDHQSSPHGV